jgi:tetratricopeptide (TPR) repeat protein
MTRWALALLAACSAPATLPDLTRAEAAESRGDIDGALAAFKAAQQSCHRLEPPRRAKQACGEALLGEPEQLERKGRTDAAIAVYLAIPARAADDPVTASTALYRAGELLLRADKPEDAWTALWKVVTAYPDEPVAADALAMILADGRTRDPKALAEQMTKLLTPLGTTQIADNLVYSLADLDAHELANPEAARAYYDRIPVDYPDSGLRDDARWFGAQISEQLGDWPGAVKRLQGLLATRETSYFTGSYFSVWLDDAQLELGKVLRDHMHDLPAAAQAFRQLPKDYPASTLRDDALYELEVTLLQAGDRAGACKVLADLEKLEPDSKYMTDAKAKAGACK